MIADAPAGTPELALRGTLRDLRALAAELGEADLARRVDALDERIRSRRLLIAVVGEHNRGKSTLINSLIGSAWLPVGQNAPTLPPIYIYGGAREHVDVVYDDGSSAESTRAELLAQSTDDAASVSYARVALPSPDLHGLVLVDTPGLNDPDTWRLSQTVYGLLPRSDLVLLVLDSAQALGASEYELIRERILSARLHRLVVVLNRADELENESQREAVRDRVAGLLAPLLGSVPLILQFSARTALRARERNDARLLARSGFPELRALLQGCAADRVHILRAATVAKARGLVAELGARLEARPAPEAAPLPPDERAAQEARVGAAIRATSAIGEAYRLELRDFAIALRERLPEEIKEASVPDIRRFLPFYIQEQYAEFLRGHEAPVLEQVRAAVTEAGLAEAPMPERVGGEAPAPGLHPYVAPDLMQDSLLVTTFMQTIGLVMHPIVTGAMMTLGPALRWLTRRVHEEDEHGTLLDAAQAATLEAGDALDHQIGLAFEGLAGALRATIPPERAIEQAPPLEDTVRIEAQERLTRIAQALEVSSEAA